MSLNQRTEMRRCGKRWATEDEALRSKRGQSGDNTVIPCRTGCGGFHLEPKRKDTSDPFPAAVRAQIDARDKCCQRCAATQALEHHHRRLKGIGGSKHRTHAQHACNGILLCRKCHGWAHRGDRRTAEAQGFIVSQSVDEPGLVGVMRFAAAGGGATQWPACDGSWADTAPEMREAA